MRYYIHSAERGVEGPFDADEIAQRVRLGELGAASLVCAEGSETWVAIGDVGELRGVALGSAGGAALPRFSLESAFSLGWSLFRARYGTLLGLTGLLLVAQVLTQIPQQIGSRLVVSHDDGTAAIGCCFYVVGLLLGIAVQWPLSVGCWLLAARLARGEAVEFGAVFDPFRRYGWVLLAYLLYAAIMLAVALPMALVAGIAAVVANASGAPSGVVLAMAVLAACLVLPVAIWVSIRAVPMALVVADPRYPGATPIEALRIAWDATRGHALGLFAVAILLGAITVVCLLLLCLPLFFVAIPLSTAVYGACYAMLCPGRSRSAG